MRKSKKKLLAMLLAGTMVFGMLPSNAFANNEQDPTSTVVDETVTTDDSTKLEEEGDTNQGTTEVEAPVEEANPQEAETENKTEEALPEDNANTEVAVDLSLEEIKLQKTEEIKAGEKYIIVYDNKKALSTGKDNIIAVPVEVEGDTVKTEITKNMVWTVDDNNNLVSELGKKLSAELTLQEDNEQSFKFNAKNVYYENGEVNTYLAYNEETSKWSFNTELNETVTYYRVVGSTEFLSELTDEQVEEYVPSNEVPEEVDVTDEPKEETKDEPKADAEVAVDNIETLENGEYFGYELATSIDPTSEYIIVGSNNNNNYALRNNNNSITSFKIDVNEIYTNSTDHSSILWKFGTAVGTNNNAVSNVKINNGTDKYLTKNSNNLGIGSEYSWTIKNSGNGKYQVYNSNNEYLTYGWSGWWPGFYLSIKSNTVEIYKKVTITPVKLTANFYVDSETTPRETETQTVRSGKTVTITRPTSIPTSSYDFVKRVIGTNELTSESDAYSITVNSDMTANYYYRTKPKYDVTVNFLLDGKPVDGYPKTEPVTSGTQYTVSKPSAVTESGVKFVKRVVNDVEDTNNQFTFTINETTTITYYYTNSLINDDKKFDDDVVLKDEYPNPGSVRNDKTAKELEGDGNSFAETGVAQVELGVTGVPMRKGVDVVLVLDVSTSMNNSSKLTNAKTQAKNFVEKILGNDTEGNPSNNRLALVTFSGYGNNSHDGTGNTKQYALKNSDSLEAIKNTITNLETNAGTDYDFAIQAANDILSTADSNRDKYIVFMTDGGPSKFTNSNGITYTYNGRESSTHVSNVMATPYLKAAQTAKEDSKVKIYSIGFGMNPNSDSVDSNNNGFSGRQAATLLQNISSGSGYYISATDGDALEDAFNKIAMAIKKAGTNASVTDIIGSDYKLQTSNTLYGNKTFGTDPKIEVKLYDLYTNADKISGTIPEGKEVGDRKGTSTTVETVTFNADGTEAYSNKKGLSTNIFINGKIEAEYFTYTIDKDGVETIEWKIGDITQKEAVLSYYVYLKDALEGTKVGGIYDTNNSAILTYNNAANTEVDKPFPVPNMPWKSAVVKYEYYLVNEQGQPVNTAGVVVDLPYRVRVGNIFSQEVVLNDTTIIYANNDNKPEGYTLFDPTSSYEVKPSANDGYGTLSGNSARLIYNDTKYTNSHVAFGVIYSAQLNPDVVVLDYGKPVIIDVMKNDTIIGATLHSVATSDITVPEVSQGSPATGFTNKIIIKNDNSEVGIVEVLNGNVKYTPSKFIESIDKFYYSAEIPTKVVENEAETTVNYYRYQEVTVMPATTVYYEDNFSGITFSGNWTTEGTTDIKNIYQDNGTVLTDGHPYGYDSSYTDYSTFSGGSAKKLTGIRDSKTKELTTTASFTFKGTGFDLISLTNNDTGTIIVEITKEEDDKFNVKKIVNNQYQSGELYQIPVINFNPNNVEQYGYGTYTVTITVGANTDFYLDAIRIYNPLGFDNVVANKQYEKDKEANANIREVRNLLIASGDFNEGSINDGAVFIDIDGGNSGKTTSSIDDYKNLGPNNEVYLKSGQSVGFKIDNYNNADSIQIGLKAPNGQVAPSINSNELTVRGEKVVLNTATDMYYDITNIVKANEGVIVITCPNDAVGLLSITNLKITSQSSSNKFDIVTDKKTAITARMLAYETNNNKSSDIDGNGTIDILDLANVASNQGKEVIIGVSTDIYKQDLTASRDINMDDLNIVRDAIK